MHHRQVGERRRSRGRCVSAGSTFGVLTHSAVVGPVVLQWFQGREPRARDVPRVRQENGRLAHVFARPRSRVGRHSGTLGTVYEKRVRVTY